MELKDVFLRLKSQPIKPKWYDYILIGFVIGLVCGYFTGFHACLTCLEPGGNITAFVFNNSSGSFELLDTGIEVFS